MSRSSASARPAVLVVDEDTRFLGLVERTLSRAGYDVVSASSAEEVLEFHGKRSYAAAIVDVRLPGMNGIDLLRRLKAEDPTVGVIVATGQADFDAAAGALEAGASDLLRKPFGLLHLQERVARVVDHRHTPQEVRGPSGLDPHVATAELVGPSLQMSGVRHMIARLAAADSPVLLEGETGTGKEVAAAAIHRLSARRHGPWVPVNCSVVPTELMETEFFGHVRGAFTGAVGDTLGLLRSAHKGTLLLDEVADLPAAMQAKLLRVLETKKVRPLGSEKGRDTDFRVVAATNRSLREAVAARRFRDDLYYRLNVVRIVMPPLREHREDIPALVSHFIPQLNAQFGRNVEGLLPGAMAMLQDNDFPGNVRELRHLLERAFALGATTTITEADISPCETGQAQGGGPLLTLAEAERDLIQRALRLFGADRAKAARSLGISRRTLYRRLTGSR